MPLSGDRKRPREGRETRSDTRASRLESAELALLGKEREEALLERIVKLQEELKDREERIAHQKKHIGKLGGYVDLLVQKVKDREHALQIDEWHDCELCRCRVFNSSGVDHAQMCQDGCEDPSPLFTEPNYQWLRGRTKTMSNRRIAYHLGYYADVGLPSDMSELSGQEQEPQEQ